MTAIYLGAERKPNYIIVDADIAESGKVSGVSRVGALVFTTDTAKWYIVGADLVLVAYYEPPLATAPA